MGNLGMGVMLNMLTGESRGGELLDAAKDKIIASVKISDDRLKLKFEDGTGVSLSDQGQSCCEYRHMSCDDDLDEFVGAKFTNAELREAPDAEDASEEHEQEFLLITTSKGIFTVVNHNEHNGYYGGFYLQVFSL